MLNDIPITQILFLDIETVPEVYDFNALAPEMQSLWSLKTKYIQEKEALTAADVYSKAGIYAEFGKVVCISTAFAVERNGDYILRVKSFFGDDEKKLLSDFGQIISKSFSGKDKYLCGHNVKEFDVPFLARRMVLHGMELPEPLDVAGRKPWEVRHLDTMELWKFGDYKHFTSLNLLARIFGIPTPKDDISGADVGRVYWEEKDLKRIKIYCEKDTITVAQLMCKFKNMNLIFHENIEIV